MASRKGIALLLAGGAPKEEDEEPEDMSAATMADFIAAVKSGDAEAALEAFKALPSPGSSMEEES